MTERKRTKVVNFRLSEDEYKEATDKCGEDISFSNFCRKAIEDTKVIKLRLKNEALDKAKISIIGKHGNNLNQLAHQINGAALTGSIDNTLAAQVLQQISEMNELMVFELALEKDKYLNN